MKKFLLKIICLTLCVVLVFTACVGCNKKEEIYAPGGEPQSFKSTNINLVSHGHSDYKIVKPAKTTDVVNHAADELQYFIQKSTGCTIPIVLDTQVQHDNNQKYLSVGETSILEAQDDIVIDVNELGDGGTTIYRRNNTVYIAGPSEYGTLYSVYRFLYYEINFVAYASDCVTYDCYDVLKVKDFDYKWRPAYAFVSSSEDCMKGSPVDTFRMYHALSSETSGGAAFYGDLFSGNWCHTVDYWVSPEQYPHLYANGNQLCFSNPESLEVAIQSGIKYARSPSGPFIQLGIRDHSGFCSCDECQRQAKLYGGNAGIYARFLNAVAEAIEVYYIENGIDRRITILGLMYLAYIDAPIVENSDGTYSPIPVDANDEKVLYNTNVLREGQVSVGAMCVPIDSCYAHPLTDTNCAANVKESQRISKWKYLTDLMSLYDYGVNLNGFTYHFNTWTHSADTFKFLYQFRGGVYAEESTHENGISSFCCFRAFLRGQQARNPWIETDKLIADFCENYYGPVGDIMLEYFYAMMENYERIYTLQKSEDFGIFSPIRLSGFWTRDIILNYKRMLKSAMHEVEISNVDDAEVYKERIYREYFLWLVNELETFSAYYTTEELNQINKEVEIGRAKYDVYR